jgi:hypothetical protein
MTRDEVIRKLAEVMAGLQAPRSLDGRVMLGAALEPWDDLKQHLTGFGWTDADAFERGLRTALMIEVEIPQLYHGPGPQRLVEATNASGDDIMAVVDTDDA